MFIDVSGRLRHGDGRFASTGGESSVPVTGSAHGNVVGSQPAFLYQRYDADGNFLKWGITDDLGGRYSKAEMAGGRLVEVKNGERCTMSKIERYHVETNPGH
jgi:hypothetical protein